MAENKLLNGNQNKMAMSRALGAAFLTHQVEQLEKTVSGNGPASGNWRERRGHSNGYNSSPNQIKRGPNTSGKEINSPARKRGGDSPAAPPQSKARQPSRDQDYDRSYTAPAAQPRRRSAEEDRKDADIIVADASVLIHALYQFRKWCRDGREEIIVVPLEALNTLDLLKKGTSSLAQRARAASRILEAQVGTNPRIRVQRDDAYVLWDKIDLENPSAQDNAATGPHHSASCPEWVRRIICCARWEKEHPEEELKPQGGRRSDDGGKPGTLTNGGQQGTNSKSRYKVVLAVLSSLPNMSPQSVSAKLADMSLSSDGALPLTPVPLPAPSLNHTQNKFEARSNGSLVAAWAAKTGVELLEIEPAMPGRGGGGDDDERPNKRSFNTKGRRPSHSDYNSGPKATTGLVERPPAVMAMMEMISQPTKVVRVLARGEKLEGGP